MVVQVVKPPQNELTVVQLNDILRNRHAIKVNHGLHESAVDLLVRMLLNWNNNKTGSTVYGLCTNVKAQTTATQVMLYNLIKKGLVEIIGVTNRSTKLYAPTGECLQLMRKYFNLRDCA